MNLSQFNGCSFSLLSPVRAPTELADERRAISTDLSDATSNLSTNQLNGSSLRPLRQSANATHLVIEEHSDEAVWLHLVLTDLKNLPDVDLFRTNC